MACTEGRCFPLILWANVCFSQLIMVWQMKDDCSDLPFVYTRLSLQSLAYLSFAEVALEVRGAHPWCVHIASSLIANQPVQHKGLPQLPDPILQRPLGKGERSCSSSVCSHHAAGSGDFWISNAWVTEAIHMAAMTVWILVSYLLQQHPSPGPQHFIKQCWHAPWTLVLGWFSQLCALTLSCFLALFSCSVDALAWMSCRCSTWTSEIPWSWWDLTSSTSTEERISTTKHATAPTDCTLLRLCLQENAI